MQSMQLFTPYKTWSMAVDMKSCCVEKTQANVDSSSEEWKKKDLNFDANDRLVICITWEMHLQNIHKVCFYEVHFIITQ